MFRDVAPRPRVLGGSTHTFDSRAACTGALYRRLVPRPILHCLVETGCHVLLELLGVLHDLVHLSYCFLVRLGQRSSGFHLALTDISPPQPKSTPHSDASFQDVPPIEVVVVKVEVAGGVEAFRSDDDAADKKGDYQRAKGYFEETHSE